MGSPLHHALDELNASGDTPLRYEPRIASRLSQTSVMA